MEELFDQAEAYEKMLEEGLKVSGESKEYYLNGRLENLMSLLPDDFSPKQILDFGCGTGEGSRALSELFPSAKILGSEIADGAIAYATKHHGGGNVEFIHIDDLDDLENTFDLVYTNGVFHHIPLEHRERAYTSIFKTMKKNGYFAFFENNPANPGTRYIMSKVPFDRDAITIKYKDGIETLKQYGFNIVDVNFLFYFPKSLKILRPLESSLKKVPLGAQYHVLVNKQ